MNNTGDAEQGKDENVPPQVITSLASAIRLALHQLPTLK
jgi:hypothetical protein